MGRAQAPYGIDGNVVARLLGAEQLEDFAVGRAPVAVHLHLDPIRVEAVELLGHLLVDNGALLEQNLAGVLVHLVGGEYAPNRLTS